MNSAGLMVMAWEVDKEKMHGKMSFVDFIELAKEWKMRAVLSGSKIVGVIMEKGNRVHISILAQYRNKWSPWKSVFPVLREVYGKYGSVATRCETPMQERFAKSLGFKWVCEKDGFHEYEMKELKR